MVCANDGLCNARNRYLSPHGNGGTMDPIEADAGRRSR